MGRLNDLLNAKKRDYNAIMTEIGRNPKAINATDSQGNSVLHLLVIDELELRDPKLVALIEKVVIDYRAAIELQNKKKQTPLQTLLLNPNTQMRDVMRLIRLGARPDVKDSNGLPLLQRIITNDLDLASKKFYVREMLKYDANLNITNHSQETGLDYLLKGPINRATKKLIIFLKGLGAKPTARGIGKFLLNKKATEFNASFYQLIKDYKELILTLPTANYKERITILLEALDDNTALGHLMWTKRGWFKPSFRGGCISTIHDELMRTLARPSQWLTKPSLVLRLLTHPTLPQRSRKQIMSYLTSDAAIFLYSYIDNLAPEQKLEALLHADVREVLKRHQVINVDERMLNELLNPQPVQEVQNEISQKLQEIIEANAPQVENEAEVNPELCNDNEIELKTFSATPAQVPTSYPFLMGVLNSNSVLTTFAPPEPVRPLRTIAKMPTIPVSTSLAKPLTPIVVSTPTPAPTMATEPPQKDLLVMDKEVQVSAPRNLPLPLEPQVVWHPDSFYCPSAPKHEPVAVQQGYVGWVL